MVDFVRCRAKGSVPALAITSVSIGSRWSFWPEGLFPNHQYNGVKACIYMHLVYWRSPKGTYRSLLQAINSPRIRLLKATASQYRCIKDMCRWSSPLVRALRSCVWLILTRSYWVRAPNWPWCASLEFFYSLPSIPGDAVHSFIHEAPFGEPWKIDIFLLAT